MNLKRRKRLQELNQKLEALAVELEEIAEEEREYYDNMPESLQGGEKGERADEVATLLMEESENLLEIIGRIEESFE